MVQMLDDDDAVWRSAAAVARAIGNGCQEEAFDEAFAMLEAVPHDRPELGDMAAKLIAALLGNHSETAQRCWRHMDRLVAMTDRHPPSFPSWPRMRFALQGLAIQYTAVQGKPADPAEVRTELDALSAQAGHDPVMQAWAELNKRAVALLHGLGQVDDAAINDMKPYVDNATALTNQHPLMLQLGEAMSPSMDFMTALQRDDAAGVQNAIDRMSVAAAKMPPDHPVRRALEEGIIRVRPFLDGPGDVTEEHLKMLSDAAGDPAADAADKALSCLSLGMALLHGGQQTDPDQLDAGIAQFRKAVSLTAADHPFLAFYHQSLAAGLLHRTEVTGITAGLAEAVDSLERARELMGGPHHPQWTMANTLLSQIHFRLGHNAQAQSTARDSQRSYAWRALLQPDAASAKTAIKDAASSAIFAARGCLGDNLLAEALNALDSGRGLMLFAATVLREATSRLEAAGRPDLARRWADSPEASRHYGLRREVLTVLCEQEGPSDRLLDPPDLAEIQSALKVLNASALVYLVPGEPGLPGLAMIAPAQGAPRYMALPNLKISANEDVEAYLTALANRSRDIPAQGDPAEFADKLDLLCDWAWRAAIGPLLEHGSAIGPSSGGGIPHIVLIPMGDLARIPWHAARRGDGTYAVQLAAFSQAASARMMCDNAFLAPAALSSAGLVVGDPAAPSRATDLLAARMEAYAIRQAFYQGARYIGRRPDGSPSPSGAGTAGQVRKWLVDPGPAAGSMLHLACHGSLRIDPLLARSYLLLASDRASDNGELSAQELIDLMAQAPSRNIALVVLAACNSGRSVHGYDEAFSLGTAFLAGGARTVLSTQWSVPDQPTSSLMFMFHHYLRSQGLPACEALRQAQAWMLDPHRRPPEQMPAGLHPAGDSDPAEVIAWAGFVHWGQ